jgi:YVTN family beta-propeller protein
MRRGAIALVVALVLVMGVAPVSARNRDKDIEKAKGDNLVGIVVSTSTNKSPGGQPYDPLEGVEVTLQGTSYKTVTDTLGLFRFKVPAGEYIIVAQKQGIGMATRAVQVKDGPTPAMVNIVLNPGQIQSSPYGTGPGGGGAPLAPGTAYVAFGQKAGPGAPAGHGPAGGYQMSTTQTYRQMILHGGTGDPFGTGGGGIQAPRPGDVNPGDYHTPIQVSPNTLMMLPVDNPGQTGYKELDAQPFWVAFNAAGTRLYVSTAAQSIQVLDTVNSNTLLTSIPTGGIITDLKLTPDGNNVLASVLGAQPGVLVIDTRTNAPQRRIPTPPMRNGEAGQPRAVAANREGTRLFVVVGTPSAGEVVALDTFTGIPQASIPVGANPTGMELSPDGRFLYVVNSSSGDVSVIDAWGFTELGRVRVGVNPQKAAVSPDGSRVFITNKGSDTVTVLNGVTQAPVATVPVGKAPVGVAVSPDGSKTFVGCTGAGSVTVLDARTGGVLLSTTPLPNSIPWGVAVKP